MARYEFNIQTGQTVELPNLPPTEVSTVIPTSLTMRQARLALLGLGKLVDVSTLITTLPEPQKTAALIEWEFAATVERDNSLVQLVKTQLSISEEDLDKLFIEGSVL